MGAGAVNEVLTLMAFLFALGCLWISIRACREADRLNDKYMDALWNLCIYSEYLANHGLEEPKRLKAPGDL